MSQTVLFPIDTQERAGTTINLPVEAAVHMFPGVISAKNAAGNVIYATDAAGLDVVGRCEYDVDNSAGAAGALSVNVKRGVFKWLNSARNGGANALAAADFGSICYVEDEQTVVKAAGSTNKVKAGTFLGLDTDGKAWVDTRMPFGNVPSADTLTALTFTTPTAAEVAALRTAVLNLLIAQSLVI
jgi:hypothetical protein